MTASTDLPAVRLRAFINARLAGQCKMLSSGSECTCALCDLDRLSAALRWYEDEARAIATNMPAGREMALYASVNVLCLDAGKRSLDVLGSASNG